MGFGISSIATYVPHRSQTVEDILGQLDETRHINFFKRILELHQVPVLSPDQTLDETIGFALKALSHKTSLEHIDAVLYAHTLTIQTPFRYGLLDKILTRFGLQNRPYFGITQLNCASAFAALEHALDLFQRYEHIENILLLSADQANHLPLYFRYIPKTTIMGDTAAAVILSREHRQNRLIETHIIRDTRFYRGYYETEENQEIFRQIYIDQLITGVLTLLEKAGYGVDDVAYVIPHNVNLYTWKKFIKKSEFREEQVYFKHIPSLGHTYATDAQINLARLIEEGVLKRGDRYILIGVGLGGFYGFAMFEH